jgi:tetratricopeptide (TPR) repeat protein
VGLDQLSPDVLNEKALRRAFRDWDLLKALGKHPLADLGIVQARHRQAGYTQTAAGRGLALREVLQSALETLKPTDGPLDPQEKRWRPYIILAEQYVRGRSPEWVQEQLYVSKGAYYGEQKRALEMLADVLQQWEEEQHQPQATEVPDQPERPHLAPQVPFMAPARPPHALVGRDKLLSELGQRLMHGEDGAITALNGLPGVGKTTLAIALAHDPEILNHFQDGILWAGLGRQPDVLALLSTWAESIGVSAEAIAGHTSVAERAAVLHTAIGLRRMLLIIDDAWQIDAALALKVGGLNCAHLLTTRLANVALDFAGDKVTRVHELDLKDGLDLLTQLSPRAVEADPEEARTLVESVGGLPLALVLMGRYLQKQSYSAQSRRLREALNKLQATAARLQLAQPQPPLELRPDLPPNTPLSLQAAIGLSDAALDQAAHRALVNLSLFPAKPNTFSEEAALALIAAPADVLDTLVDHGLVECVASDRYTLHQTIADYASLQGAEAIAVERLVSYFVRYVEANSTDFKTLDRELANIQAALEATFKANLHGGLIHLIVALYSFLETRGLYPVCERHLRQADTFAEARGDLPGHATVLYYLGDLEVRRGQFNNAKAYLQQSLDLARAMPSHQLEADNLFQLGLACSYAGELFDGRAFLEQCLLINRELGNRKWEGYALNALSYVCEELCDYGQALAYLGQALHVCHETGERRGEGWAHYNFGTVYLPMGDFARAKVYFEQCLSIYRELGDRRGEGWLHYHLGRLHRQLGHFDEATTLFEQALQILNEIGDWMGQGFAIHNLGLVAGELGDDAAALARFEQALQIFRAIGCQTGEAQAYQSLGIRLRRLGDAAGAKRCFEQSLCHLNKKDHPRSVSKDLANLGLVCLHLGEIQAALDNGQQAVKIAQEIGARPTQAYALTFLGHILVGLGDLDEAAATYRQAIALRRELDQLHWALDPLAGLTRVALMQANWPQARAAVEEILDYLEANATAASSEYGLAGTDSLGEVYLNCYRVLQVSGKSGDPRARAVLRTASRRLQERAAKIGDEKQRRSFLKYVPAHCEIMEASALLADTFMTGVPRSTQIAQRTEPYNTPRNPGDT